MKEIWRWWGNQQVRAKTKENIDATNLLADSYSVYLLSQIKPTPLSVGTVRTGCESVLDVVFACYGHPSENRNKLGGRLMAQVRIVS